MKKIGAVALSLLLPAFAFAQFGEVNTFMGKITTFINGTLIPLIFTFALLFFLYGAFKYFIQGGGNEEARETGTTMMVNGIIGFVLMVSIWGIVNMIAGGLGWSATDTIQNIPNVPTTNN